MFKWIKGIFKKKPISMAEEQIEVRRSLTPKILDKTDCSYPCVDELQYAIEKTNCKNIAITGVYGSGKSSVIETYLAKRGFCKNLLKISLSTFIINNQSDEKADKDIDKKPDNIDKYNADIEYKIVQHILYKSDPQSLRQSHFDRIVHKTDRKNKWLAFCVLLAVLAIIVLLNPGFLKTYSFYNLYITHLSPDTRYWVDIIAEMFAAIYLLYCLGYLFYKGLSNYYPIRINKVKAKSVEVEFSKNSSVFNQLLDEIVYSFNANRYDLVIFEDLDRLYKSEHLFLKLRELNMLLNESKAFQKNRFVVKFVYAIRDDVFTQDLRTKCFDYIIPVAPVIDQFNASDYLLKHKVEFFKTISDDSIRDLGIWIVGFREMNNILNEFCLFKKLMMREGMSEEKLLAMTIYKNIQPKDYALLHEKEGLLYNVFINKRMFTGPFTKEFAETVAKLNIKVKEDRESVRNIRRQYLDVIVRDKHVKTLYVGEEGYSIEEVQASDILFDKFRKDGFTRYYYVDEFNEATGTPEYDIRFKNIEAEIGQGITYEEAVYPLISNINNNNEEIASLNRKINDIENEGLSTLFNKVDGEVNKRIIKQINREKTFKGNHIDDDNTIAYIQAMIRGGYIAEDYPSYVSYYHSGFILDKDFDFLNTVLQGITQPYNTPVVNPAIVVNKLVTSNFNKPNILNFSILDYLMKDKSKEHLLEKFIMTARNSPAFIIEYCQSVETPYTFLKLLFKGWDYPINDIQSIDNEELKSEMLVWYFYTCCVDARLKREEIEFINDNYLFINQNISRIDINRLKKFLGKYKIRFNVLEPATDANQKALLEYVRSSAGFKINHDNLFVLLGENFDTQSFTTISKFKDDGFKKYIIDNISSTVTTFSDTSTKEESIALVDLINNQHVDDNWLVNYIAQQDTILESFNGVFEKRQYILLKTDKINVTWDNILDYFNLHTTPEKTFFEFIVRHVNVLASAPCNGSSDLSNQLVLTLFGNNTNLDTDSYKELLNSFELQLSYQDVGGLDEDRMIALINKKGLEYSSDTLAYISAAYAESTLALFFIMYFEEIDVDDNVACSDYNTNQLGIKILESDLSLEQKIKFLDKYATIEDAAEDGSYYASLICDSYVEFGSLTELSDKNLLMSAIVSNKELNSWRSKITLINMINAHYPYNKETEVALINSLGGDMYPRLNTIYGRAHFDINEENRQLISYLKEHGHYVSNFYEDDYQIRVSFMAREP